MISQSPDAMFLIDFFRNEYVPKRAFDASFGARQQLEIAINRFRVYLEREPRLRDLTEDNLIGLLQHTVGHKLSPVTANMRAKNLMTLWRYAKRRGYVHSMPEDIRLLKVDRTLPRAWTENEMEAIIKSARNARGRFQGVPADKWWCAFLLVMYDTGVRLSPMWQIRFDEIDFANKLLTVPAHRMKNRVEQFFRLHDQTIEAILETLPPRRRLVFPWPFRHYRALYGRYKTILRRAGLPFTKRDMFHKIRRTTASHIARLVGESLAIQQLGHQSPETIKRYIDPRFTANHTAAELMPRPSWSSPKALEVEVTAQPEKEKLEPVTVRFTAGELRGEGDDVMARLVNKDFLDGQDIADITAALGMQHQELAAAVKVSPNWLSRVVRGHQSLSWELNQRIRRYLGFIPGKDGDIMAPYLNPDGRKDGAA